MRIDRHLLEEAQQLPSPSRSGAITPRGIVMHYTASFSFSGAVDWLRKRGSRASAHLVMGSDGELAQLVPFNVKAWHAGRSKYQGFSGLNGSFIGIEICNVGWLKSIGGNRYEDWAGNTYTEGQGHLAGRELLAQKHPRVGGGMLYWPSYTARQLDDLESITRALIAAYPTIEHIVSHEEIDTRGWKTDPGPQFPMQRYKRLLGNDRSDEEPEAPATGEAARIKAALGAIATDAAEALSTGWAPDLPDDVKQSRWTLETIRRMTAQET